MPLRSLSSSRAIATRLAVRVLAVAMLAAPLAACGWWDDDPVYTTQATDPPDLLYNQGLVAMKAGDYSKAVKRFDALDKQYPQTDWQKKAILMSAATTLKPSEPYSIALASGSGEAELDG